LEPRDFLSRFVNWFSSIGEDQEPKKETEGGKDFFSRFMNDLSDYPTKSVRR
jgi:hypothetical protein